MTEPQTEAGRRLVRKRDMAIAAGFAYTPTDDDILAIEAEAAAAERERLRGEPFRVLGFTLRELQAAIATADLYHPQWRRPR